MTRTYRALLLASLVLGLFSAFFDAVLPAALPLAFIQAQDAYFSSLSPSIGLLIVLGGAIFFVVGVVSTVGLYKFRPWAPRLGLVTSVLALPYIALFGATAISGYSMALNVLSCTLWGAVLALTYFSPLRKRFARANC